MLKIYETRLRRSQNHYRHEIGVVSVHKWPYSATPRLLRDRSACQSRLGRDRSGIACAAYTSTPPRNAADFLELAVNRTFLNRKLTSALNATVDTREEAASAEVPDPCRLKGESLRVKAPVRI